MEHRLNLVLKNFGYLLPYFFAGAGIALLARMIWHRLNKKREVPFVFSREVCIIAFVGYLCALMVALFHGGSDGGQINLIPFSQIMEYFELIGENTGAFIVYLFGNIFSFTPFAFFLPIALPKIKPWRGIVLCLFVSFLTEIVQHFLGRFSDIDDVLLNTLGAAFGAGLFLLIRKHFPNAVSRWQGKPQTTPKPE